VGFKIQANALMQGEAWACTSFIWYGSFAYDHTAMLVIIGQPQMTIGFRCLGFSSQDIQLLLTPSSGSVHVDPCHRLFT
jgi:hypothetical protein